MSWRSDDWKEMQTLLIRKAYVDWNYGKMKARTRHGVDGEISEASADAMLKVAIDHIRHRLSFECDDIWKILNEMEEA